MDLRIIGIGIAITFAIIALSAVTLYLTFRIKETFREDKGTKVQIAKIGFIIGILFLASGLFYFFAQAMYQPDESLNDANVNNTDESQISTINNLTTLDLSYPDTVKTDETYLLTFNINNPSSRTIRDATIKLSGLDPYEVKSNFNVDNNVINLGDSQPGKRSGYFQLKAPSNPTTLEGELIFESKDSNSISRKIKIIVKGNSIPSMLNPIITAIPTPPPQIYIGGYYYPPGTSISPAAYASGTSGTTPEATPIKTPTATRTESPTANPTESPTATPTVSPTATPTESPTATPTESPTATPTESPTATPTESPTATPTESPTAAPTESPTATPTESPTATPTESPTATPTESPTATPTESPTATPTESPTAAPTESPTATPTESPTATPTESPTAAPTESPTAAPTDTTPAL